MSTRENIRLIARAPLRQNRYNLCVRHLQVIVKSHGQHTYLQESIKSSKPEFYANASLPSQV